MHGMMEETKLKKSAQPIVTLSDTTTFKGVLRFKEMLCIRGNFSGTIQAESGELIIDKGAAVQADLISVTSLTVYGTVRAPVRASDKIDLCSGAEIRGDLAAGRLRIADGVIFEGKCSMIDAGKEDIEIFARPTSEIKAELRQG
ncbi:MAG: polymer-forming cytoskeletal protein [Spirochaetaceae bacterium]|jgi:cytoskeletal protein CcmA (bactofilin family)|nr:polymer-forming cytoskeletal protein [Spirochaetaceae bacterium]